MSPKVLDKLRELIEGGITVVGQRPKRSLGLVGYPASQDEVARPGGIALGRREREKHKITARSEWVGSFRTPTLEKRHRRGWLAPDLELSGVTNEIEVDWIHRRTEGMDIYFVANLSAAAGEVEAAFRMSGMVPELWDPVTGDMRSLPEFYAKEGRTVVPLQFAPNQSWFIVFQKPVSKPVRIGAKNSRLTRAVSELTGPWEVGF